MSVANRMDKGVAQVGGAERRGVVSLAEIGMVRVDAAPVGVSGKREGLSVTVEKVSHRYGDQPSGGGPTTVTDVSLEVAPGEFVTLIGPSGCGKTTLLNMLAALEHPHEGSIAIEGRPPRLGDPRVAYVFARDALLGWRTALENAALGLQLIGIGKRERRRRAEEALAALGLSQHVHLYPSQMSQGMRQRVALARAFSMEPKLLLMDEPFSALDAQTRIVAQNLFLDLWERAGCTVVLVTHDLHEAVALSDKVVVMSKGPDSGIKRVAGIALQRPRVLSELQRDTEFHSTWQALWHDLATEFLGESRQ